MALTHEQERDFIKMDLGPILEKAGYGTKNLALMIADTWTRDDVHLWAKDILSDKEAAKYVSGIAFHWYNNNDGNLGNLETTHNIDPTKFILSSEACEVWPGKPKHVYLGSWDTFERYANDIIVVSIEQKCFFVS